MEMQGGGMFLNKDLGFKVKSLKLDQYVGFGEVIANTAEQHHYYCFPDYCFHVISLCFFNTRVSCLWHQACMLRFFF